MTTVSAQSAIDAYSLSQGDLRGTARFMSMAGAFGALGGDLSTLNQNPAGIGVYRSSEIGVTVDFDMQSMKTDNFYKDNHTHVYCNNFGYVGSAFTGSDIMPVFYMGARPTLVPHRLTEIITAVSVLCRLHCRIMWRVLPTV